MKKILSLILVVLILAALALPISAVDIDAVDITKSLVDDDLRLWNDGYQTLYPADKSDTGIYLIHMQEYGYAVNGRTSDYALYFYIYNPSMKHLSVSDYNKIQIASTWKNYIPISYSKYTVSVVNASEDDRFVKLKLDCAAYKSNVFFIKNSNGSRSYTVSGIELRSEYNEQNSSNVGDYTVGYTFTFSGYSSSNNLSCKREDITVIELDVHQTSYLTGDSGKETDDLDNGFYSNQINSVYFSIPKKYESEFGNLYAIDYEYYQYRTAPMILVDNKDDFSYLDIFVNQNLSDLSNFKVKFYDKLYDDPYNGQQRFGFYWGVKKTTLLPGTYVYDQYPHLGTYQDYYSILLPVNNLNDRNNLLISAEELHDYFASYGVKMGGNDTVNHSGKYVGSNRYWGDLFDLDYFSNNYYRQEVNINEVFSLPSLADTLPTGVNGFIKNWRKYNWDVAFNTEKYDNSIDDVKYIEEIKKLTFPSNDLTASEKYLVHETDIPAFRNYVQTANDNNETVYLLRYAFSDDYYYLPLKSEGLDGNIAMVQETVYLDFDIITLSFRNNKGSITVIPVVSSPTDGFTGIENITPPPPSDKDGDGDVDDSFNKLIGLLIGFTIVLVVIFVVTGIKKRKRGKEIMISNLENTNLGTLSWKDKLRFANERRRKNISDYRQRRKEKLEYKASVQKNKLAKYEAKQKARQIRYEADSYRDENRYSRAERKNISRESRARVRSMNRASKRRSGRKSFRSSRRSRRSYNRYKRY